MKRSAPPWVWCVLAFLALENARGRAKRYVPETVRARAVARARDADGRPEPLAWEDVPGIGEVRARDIRAWCRARGIEPDPLCAGRGAPGAPGYPVAVERISFALRLGLLMALGACRGGDDAGVAPPAHPASGLEEPYELSCFEREDPPS